MDITSKSRPDWSLACRICLTNAEDDMKYIFGEVSRSDDIVTKIIKCGGVPVDIMDGMPDRICNQCLLDLEIAYRFRSSCQESYSHLLRIIKDQKLDIQSSHDELKEESDSRESDDVNNKLTIDLQEESLNPIYLSEEALLDEDLIPEMEDVTDTMLYIKEEAKDDDLASGTGPEVKASRVIRRVRREKCNDPSARYMCYCCGNLYKSQSKLNQHIKLHSAEKPHECEICQKKFAQNAQLSRHMNSHTGNRPYKCKYCSSSFADPSTRIKHERIHTNDRPFKCLECGKAFSYSNVLKVHQKTHTGEKPFSCSVCHKKFTQMHHKKSHERTHSNYLDANGRAKKSYVMDFFTKK